jgi:hypothetical protein
VAHDLVRGLDLARPNPHPEGVRCLGVLIAALLSSLVLTGPALADDATVGPGQVITDPSAETEPDPPVADDGYVSDDPPPPDASGRRGEVHVLDSASTSSAPSATPAAPASAAVTPARATVRPASTTRTLPFTGVNAGALALIGFALLAGGSGLLAVLRQPVQ